MMAQLHFLCSNSRPYLTERRAPSGGRAREQGWGGLRRRGRARQVDFRMLARLDRYMRCSAVRKPPPLQQQRGSGGYMWVGLGRYSSAFLGTELLQRSDGMGREGTPYRRSRPADVAQT